MVEKFSNWLSGRVDVFWCGFRLSVAFAIHVRYM
jgi:hypothetical protein